MELAEQTASMELHYLVTTGSGKGQICYLVEELYRIRYTPERVYLLEFERTMDQIPAIEGNIYGNDKIMLGIVGEDTALVGSIEAVCSASSIRLTAGSVRRRTPRSPHVIWLKLLLISTL